MSVEENSQDNSPDSNNQQELLKNISTGRDLITGDLTQNNTQVNIYLTSKNTNRSTDSSTVNLSIEQLVQQIRQKNRDRIQRLHSTIQLLDVANPVEIDRLYVDVNVLSEPTNYKHLEIDDFLQNSSQKTDLDRLGLPKVQERVSGIKAVEDYQKLMVLGKPGAGKSTFLQHVVIECNNGNLLSDRVPILIKLRDYVRKARREEDFNLKLHICSYLQGCSQQEIEALMQEGRVLLLLDGLDEIPEVDVDKVIDEINWFIDEYTLNHIIITCRLQGQKYKFNDFTYLEIADFNETQIVAFAEKWFAASYNNHVEKGKAKAQKFIIQLKLPENKQILELVTTPLLLSLVCKVFSVKHQFYSKRHELYEQGLEILLSKWDESRRIQRDRIYQNLTLAEKQKLLSYIAASKFKQEQYVLFEKREIQRYIAEYLDISEEDSQPVLESIIVQHGLLIERAQRIYSFSHLTFQEYFAAKWFVDNSAWKDLAIHVTQEHWQDIFLLANSLCSDKKAFLLAIKNSIEELISKKQKTQLVLQWLNQKSINEKSISQFVLDSLPQIRSYYLDLLFAYEININNGFTLNPTALVEINLYKKLHDNENYYLAQSLLLDRVLWWILAYINTSGLINFAFGYQNEIGNALALATKNCKILVKLELISLIVYDKLLNLWQKLPNLDNGSKDIFINWWQVNGENWLEQLRNLMIDYRDIGHDWQFTEEEKSLLQKYYDANQLLISCLNISFDYSDDFWQKITEDLFLPIAGVKKLEELES